MWGSIFMRVSSHCAQYNFTGWIQGWDKTTGAVVELYAMEGGKSDHKTSSRSYLSLDADANSWCWRQY